jgi:hypothetical protein
MTIDLSLVVPVFDPDSSQIHRVMRMIDSVAVQTAMPGEVIFTSSHPVSYESQIKKKLSQSTKVVFATNKSISAPANLNDAVDRAGFNVVKVLFQDDFLLGANHLSRLQADFDQSPAEWAVTSSVGCIEESGQFLRPVNPRFTNSLVRGINRIGAPSVVIFRKRSFVPFNEALRYTFDCEWYLSMTHNFGAPEVFKDIMVGIGIHKDQATHWAHNLLGIERKYLRELHKSPTPFLRRCSCSQGANTQS